MMPYAQAVTGRFLHTIFITIKDSDDEPEKYIQEINGKLIIPSLIFDKP